MQLIRCQLARFLIALHPSAKLIPIGALRGFIHVRALSLWLCRMASCAAT